MPLEELDVSNHPEVRALQEAFLDKVDRCIESLRYCPNCKERWFEKTFHRNSSDVCTDCKKSHKDHGTYKLTAANDMDPFPIDPAADPAAAPAADPRPGLRRGYPFWLPKLFAIEEMMIARVSVVMKSYILNNGSYGYRGHVLNLERNLEDLVTAVLLPIRVEDLKVWIVRKLGHDLPTNYKDFRMRREAVRKWLNFLIQYSCYYHGIVGIDMQYLDGLPTDGSIADRVRIITEKDIADADESDDRQQGPMGLTGMRTMTMMSVLKTNSSWARIRTAPLELQPRRTKLKRRTLGNQFVPTKLSLKRFES